MTTSPHPGVVRSLRRIADREGFVLVCAIDHLAEFEVLLGPVGSVPYADIVAAKASVVRAVSSEVSAVLLDPDFGIGHLLVSGAVPPTVGLVASFEAENYEFPDGPRGSILRPGWTPAVAAAAGADMLKFLWFYRPDLDAEVAEAQRRLLTETYEQCRTAGIPLVVEPIWYPVHGEDPSSPEWQRSRVAGIVRSAVEAEQLGCDMLKIEFPGSAGTEAGRQEARTRCEELDAAVSVPWVILSAGVDYAEFAAQLAVACSAGASGYMAGRSVWSDVITTGDASAVVERIRGLNRIVRGLGRPLAPVEPLADALAALPRGWYR